MNPSAHLLSNIKAEYIKFDKKTDTEICLRAIDDILYIDFQGTISKADWIYNFKIAKNSFFENSVHQGMFEKYKAVKLKLYEAVLLKSVGIKKVIFRGFSQGGALATLFYTDFKLTQNPIKTNYKIECIIFGSPAVLSAGFSDYTFRDLKNYYIRSDFVCWNFPGFLGYRRQGHWIQIDDFPWYKRILPSFKIHTVANYLKYLAFKGL